MSDCIRREDAVSRISDFLMIELQGKRLPTWNEVYNAINDIPSAEPERKWTPVTEALPEEDTEVLVTVRFDGIEKRKKPTRYVEIASQIDGEWSSYSDEFKVMRSRHHVIAWMPLPEPAKIGDGK